VRGQRCRETCSACTPTTPASSCQPAVYIWLRITELENSEQWANNVKLNRTKCVGIIYAESTREAEPSQSATTTPRDSKRDVVRCLLNAVTLTNRVSAAVMTSSTGACNRRCGRWKFCVTMASVTNTVQFYSMSIII